MKEHLDTRVLIVGMVRSLEISAKSLGWKYAINKKIDGKHLSKIFGFEKNDNFSEKELGEILLLVSTNDGQEQ